MKTVIEENKKKENRGGARPGAGRPRNGRTKAISLRISSEAYEIYQSWANKTEVIDTLIKQNKQIGL